MFALGADIVAGPMRKGFCVGALVVAAGAGGTAAPPAMAAPIDDYAAIRRDWQPDRTITRCRFTLTQLENARRLLTPEDGYTDFPAALAAEIARRRGGGCPAGGNARPVITGLRVTRRTFRAGAARSRGTTIVFRLSKAATVRLTIDRVVRGRRIRYVRTRTLARRYRGRGVKRVRFTGTGLPKVRYRLTAVATDSARRRSVPKRTFFRIRP
jgi:hypothetical protein